VTIPKTALCFTCPFGAKEGEKMGKREKRERSAAVFRGVSGKDAVAGVGLS